MWPGVDRFIRIIVDYFELLYVSFFGLSTLFVFFLFWLSYRWRPAIQILAYIGAATVPFWLGIASRFYYERAICTAELSSCNNMFLVSFFIYFLVTGGLSLGFWVIRSRQSR